MSSLLRLECKQKISSNAFRTRIFLHFRSYSSGIETTNMFILLRSSLENHTRFQTKKKQKGKNTNLCCGILYLYGLYREVSHPTPPPPLPGKNNNNGPNVLFQTVFKHCNCFLSSVATDCKDGHGLKLEEIGQLFPCL